MSKGHIPMLLKEVKSGSCRVSGMIGVRMPFFCSWLSKIPLLMWPKHLWIVQGSSFVPLSHPSFCTGPPKRLDLLTDILIYLYIFLLEHIAVHICASQCFLPSNCAALTFTPPDSRLSQLLCCCCLFSNYHLCPFLLVFCSLFWRNCCWQFYLSL